MFTAYNIKLFAAPPSIHSAKLKHQHKVNHRRKRLKKSLRVKQPVGSELLGTIALAAEFTIFRRLGLFHSYRRLPRCRSPPLRFGFLKKSKRRIKMIQINLRDFYPIYTSDCFVEVPDEVAALLLAHVRNEAAYQRRTYRHRAHYSLDRGDGIEHDILFVSLSPCEIYERKVTNEQLHAAIASLPDKQAKRVYAHYFLGMSKAAIARAEGIGKATVGESINRGLKGIEKFLKKLL